MPDRLVFSNLFSGQTGTGVPEKRGFGTASATCGKAVKIVAEPIFTKLIQRYVAAFRDSTFEIRGISARLFQQFLCVFQRFFRQEILMSRDNI